jgi:hypothetical protein
MRTQVAVLREWAEWIIKPEGFEIKEVVYLDSLFLFYLGFDAKSTLIFSTSDYYELIMIYSPVKNI